MKGIYRMMLVLAVAGGVCLWMAGADFINMSKDPINMNEVDWSTLEAGDHVNFTVDAAWACLYTETTTESRYGITTNEYESARGYVIPCLYSDAQGNYYLDYFIGLRLGNSGDYATMDQILKETDDWYYDTTGFVNYGMTTLYIDGTLEKMDKEEKSLMMEYLVDYCGYSTSEATEMVCPYMVTRGNMGASKTIFFVGIFCMGAFLVMLFFVLKQYFSNRNELASHTYMGVSQTGSTDIYGGTNYGGNNFGGTNYGASDQYNKPYDGSVYGDTSYGGTNTYGSNTYGSNNTYGNNDTYGGTNTYGSTNAYGGTNTYGSSDQYGNPSQQEEKWEGPWQPYQ